MIKLFRRIRRNFLVAGNLKSYLPYAFGEILLVVIGILIALQINNWNERQREKRVELEILQTFHEDLQTDIKNLKAKIYTDSVLSVSNKRLLDFLKSPDLKAGELSFEGQVNFDRSKLGYNQTNWEKDIELKEGRTHNSFGIINRANYFYPQTFAYESLKSNGLATIRNSKLRKRIVNLYDNRYATAASLIQIQQNLYISTNSIMLDHLETKGIATYKEPNDLEELVKNQKFINFLSHMYGENLQFLGFYRQCLEDIYTVKNEVDNELLRKNQVGK